MEIHLNSTRLLPLKKVAYYLGLTIRIFRSLPFAQLVDEKNILAGISPKLIKRFRH
jgi:hypothetical protein